MARIVIIDDEPALLRMSARTLRRAGHETVTFESARVAIDHLRNAAADLLITDIFMPDMEGLETLKQARALRPDMPIVAVSGGGSLTQAVDYLEYARRLGAAATLPKPFRPAELLDLVATLLVLPRDGPVVG